MKRHIFVIGLCVISSLAAGGEHGANEGGWTSSRPDGHAPIGVMTDHTHGAGEFMWSYRFMYMAMDGNRDGAAEVPVAGDEEPEPVGASRCARLGQHSWRGARARSRRSHAHGADGVP